MSSKPLFDVPPGATATVHIIDSTFRLSGMAISHLMKPPMDGFDEFTNLPTWSFLVESATGRKVLFDLGVPKDLNVFPPSITNSIKKNGWDVQVAEDVADILKQHNVDPADINSVIWSHYHFDHIGDISKFPGSTELVVGPGFKQRFTKAYPTDPDSPVREAYWSDRQLREINFDDSSVLHAGPFRAFDFFGDGSFYLLDTPGHCIGHLAGLARTTRDPDTFIFMGGDLCHHGGELRPSSYIHIPDAVQYPLPDMLRSRLSNCPGGELFRNLNVRRGRGKDEPFFETAIGEDLAEANETVNKAQMADVQDNVFFIFAHEVFIRGVVDLFPSVANEWKSKGWREKTYWAFLSDLAIAAAGNESLLAK